MQVPLLRWKSAICSFDTRVGSIHYALAFFQRYIGETLKMSHLEGDENGQSQKTFLDTDTI